ncbi:MAG: lmo0937 family membrane protein [Balneolaceae bacterium]
MRSLLYIIAVIMVIGWLFGFLVYSIGGLIHILLVIAVIAILLDLIGSRRTV